MEANLPSTPQTVCNLPSPASTEGEWALMDAVELAPTPLTQTITMPENAINPTPNLRLAPMPPRGVAISGVIFAILFLTSLTIIRISIPADPADSGGWLSDPGSQSRLGIALNLLPFTGIAFLWFMGALRNHIGELEDQFFATVFLGSGFLFVGMLFTSSAASTGLLHVFGLGNLSPEGSETYAVGRRMVFALLFTFGLKMAAVFMSVASMIGSRTSVLPRYVTRVGAAFAILIILFVTDFAWFALLFPCWVLLVSTWIFATENKISSHAQAKTRPDAPPT
jgi:hypothetical protein